MSDEYPYSELAEKEAEIAALRSQLAECEKELIETQSEVTYLRSHLVEARELINQVELLTEDRLIARLANTWLAANREEK